MLRETIERLVRILNGWDRRLRLQTSLVWLPRGIMLSLGVGLALALVARLRPFLMPEQILLASGIAVAVGVALTLAVVWLRQHDALAMARLFDARFGLKERLSTALELAGGGIRTPNDEITSRLMADTLQRAGQINAAAYLPLRVNWRDLGLVALLAVALVALVFLPNPQQDVLAQQQTVESTIQQQVESLEGVREQIAANEALEEAVQREMLEALDETIEQLSRQELSQEEAVATLSDLAERMQQIAETAPGEVDAERQALREALSQSLQEAAQALQQMESAPAAGAGAALAAGEPQTAGESLQELAERLDEMSEEERQALAEALREAAAALAETDPELADSLEEAADALQQGDQQAAREALEEAGARLGQMAEADPGGDNPTRQMASQAAQQAGQSAQDVAQAGQPHSGQPGQNQTGESAPDTSTTRLQPDPSGGTGEGARMGEMSGEGEGQQPGEGAATGQTDPRQAEEGASASAGAGEGESNGEEGSFAATGEQIAQDNAPDGTGLTDYEPVFAPQSIGAGQGQGLQVGGSGEPGDEVVREGDFVEDPEGEAIVGYNEVFRDYANAAGQALERDYIPLTLRDVIRNYFASLEP